ncbi:hypothetical protein RG963_04330 [Methanosarcina sp. Z-7115]|uniref:Uncharacterized protein n=1 Tax=Methanosarcina baikalica TaxID=3073890 RepID=A0ABU2CZ96_9EURY|nr:hypothetical protein [Methanosarcina sp. Z-7115]MDR7665027.1 hypothetical protein [Methanosarcina sp. Z-7115]
MDSSISSTSTFFVFAICFARRAEIVLFPLPPFPHTAILIFSSPTPVINSAELKTLPLNIRPKERRRRKKKEKERRKREKEEKEREKKREEREKKREEREKKREEREKKREEREKKREEKRRKETKEKGNEGVNIRY